MVWGVVGRETQNTKRRDRRGRETERPCQAASIGDREIAIVCGVVRWMAVAEGSSNPSREAGWPEIVEV